MIKNMIILTGEDDFRLREREKFYKTKFLEKYEDGAVEKFTNNDSFYDLENTIFTSNLFGGKRLVFVEKFWDSDNFELAEKTSFFDKLSEEIDQVTLIIVEPKLDKRLKSTKFLIGTKGSVAKCKIENFEPLADDQIYEWIEAYAVGNNGRVKRRVSQKLLKWCGRNLWNLSSEIKKLILCSDGGDVTEDMIEEMTITHPEVLIWDFLEGLSSKNLQKAMGNLKKLFDAKTTVHEILSMVFREVRIHAQLQYGVSKGMHERQIVEKTKLHPFVVKKTINLSRKFSMKQIKEMYDDLFLIDKGMKTGGLSIVQGDTSELKLALERFVLKNCKK